MPASKKATSSDARSVAVGMMAPQLASEWCRSRLTAYQKVQQKRVPIQKWLLEGTLISFKEHRGFGFLSAEGTSLYFDERNASSAVRDSIREGINHGHFDKAGRAPRTWDDPNHVLSFMRCSKDGREWAERVRFTHEPQPSEGQDTGVRRKQCRLNNEAAQKRIATKRMKKAHGEASDSAAGSCFSVSLPAAESSLLARVEPAASPEAASAKALTSNTAPEIKQMADDEHANDVELAVQAIRDKLNAEHEGKLQAMEAMHASMIDDLIRSNEKNMEEVECLQAALSEASRDKAALHAQLERAIEDLEVAEEDHKTFTAFIERQKDEIARLKTE